MAVADVLRRYDMYIGGNWTPSATGETFCSLDPYTGEDWAEVAKGGPDDVDLAVRAARHAFDEGPWSRMTGADRARIMRRLASLIEENADEIAEIEVHDNGKLFREMQAQLRGVIPDWFWFFAGAADKINGDVIPTSKSNYFTYLVREPVGVVAAVTAWNSPTLLLAYKLGPALAAGCTFVLKPATTAPVSALAFARLADEAGLPPGVFNVVTGDAQSVGEPLVSHRGVDKVAFTGSSAAGIRVAQLAASHLAPVSLELGGKSPQVVFADADLDAASNGAIAGIFAAAGQTCVAGSRLIVQESVHDELVERIVERARRIVIGNPMDPATEIGPMAFPEQFEKVMEYIDSGRTEGATVATGGGRPAGLDHGLFVEPTVFTDARSDMRVVQEEIFGPVLSVLRFRDEDEAIRLANNTAYGLASGVWTKDIQRAFRVSKGIRAGTVWVNGYRVVGPEVPFGGTGISGFGREGGLESLNEYLRTKSVWIELSGATRDPFRIG